MTATVTTGNPPAAPRPLLERAREQAALRGPFVPRALLQSLAAQPLDAATLREGLVGLSALCSEVKTADGYRWSLKPQPRRDTLAALVAQGRLGEALSGVMPDPDDEFGRVLADALRGHSPDMATLSAGQLDELRAVLPIVNALPPSGAGALPTEADLTAELAQRHDAAALQWLLPTPLIGRDAEIERLLVYAGAPAPLVATPLRLDGIGGSGKSALLAEVVGRLRAADTPALVLWLDFDQAGLANADDAVLMLEAARQLAVYRPALRAPAAAFREQALQRLQSRGERSASEYDSAASASSELWSLWTYLLGQALPTQEPVLLIFDTFEEIMLRGDSEVQHVIRWLTVLRSEGRLGGLRCVLSGRALPDDTTLRALLGAAEPPLTLGELAPPAAEALLAVYLGHLGRVAADFPCAELVALYGGHPLLLKILARHLAEAGTEGAQALIDAARGAGNGQASAAGFDRRFAQSFLYTRLLRRLRSDDPDVERLAYPGLALRRVSADLIQHVLAEPCGLHAVDAARAQALFDKLARQIWLVEPGPSADVVLHRRDLRRLMLLAMAGADKADRAAAHAIHRAAAGWYDDGRDRHLAPEDQKLEAWYHWLMGDGMGDSTGDDSGDDNARVPASLPQPAEAMRLVSYLGADIDNLPLRSRAHVKFQAKRSLTEAEAAALDALSQQLRQRQMAQRRTKRGGNVFDERPPAEIPLAAKAPAGAAPLPSPTLAPPAPAPQSARTRGTAKGRGGARAGSAGADFPPAVLLGSAPPTDAAAPASVELLRDAFAAGRLDVLRQQWEAAVDAFLGAAIGKPINEGDAPDEFCHWPVWHSAMLALTDATLRDALLGRLRDAAHDARLDAGRPLLPWRIDSLASGHALAMLLALLGEPLPGSLLRLGWRAGRQQRGVDDLRRWQLLESTTPGQTVHLLEPAMLRDFTREVVAAWTAQPPTPRLRLPDDARYRAALQPLQDRGQNEPRPAPPLSALPRPTTTLGIRAEPGALLDPASRLLLRGLSPELYPLLRGAATELPDQQLQAFAVAARGRALVWPAELQPDALGTALLRDRRRWIATLVDFSDRCGLLTDLAADCAEHALPTQRDRLHAIHQLVTAYDRRLLGAPGAASEPG